LVAALDMGRYGVAGYDAVIGSGYQDRLPGIGAFNPRDMTAPGSSQDAVSPAASAPGQDGPPGSPTVAVVVPPGTSLVNADRVPVGPFDTASGSQADLYSGPDPSGPSGLPGELFGTTGAGGPWRSHNRHPNSAGAGAS
jgi:hypothetical protein